MDYEKALSKIKNLKEQEEVTEKHEIECLKRYHEGFKDGLSTAESLIDDEDNDDNEKEKFYDEGFMDAIEMLCMKEFGVDATKTRANTKNGICRNAAKLIRESLKEDVKITESEEDEEFDKRPPHTRDFSRE